MRTDQLASIRQQIKKQPRGNELLSFLDVCQLVPTRIEYLNPTDLALHLALKPQHKDQLGLQSDELLLLYLTHRTSTHGSTRRSESEYAPRSDSITERRS